jgi:Outer membrane protein and related peptidoglycan-associated (lipo)proteins
MQKRIKKKFVVSILFIGLICTASDLNAQFESAKWVFGNGGGIDFANGEPVAFSGSKIRTSEGCSAMSTGKGELLFYTDGVSIWNRYHEIMPNGRNLNGNFSSTQSSIIVPLPGSTTIFYVFTMDWEAHNGGFCYSIVDMTREKGLGDVTLKNQQIKSNCAEKLGAIRHTNNKDIWLVIHEYGSNAFLAYLLTKDGLVLKPVVSNIGLKYDKSLYNTIGYLKIAPDKKKLAVAINGDCIVQLFDFDSGKGTLSNPVTLRLANNMNPYGLEFSPNGKLLYISLATKGDILQANLSAGNESEIQKSLCSIVTPVIKEGLGALQLASDGKIYVAEYQSKSISRIENPDVVGNGCNFTPHAIALKNATCMFGLPTFFHEYVKVIDFKQNARLKYNTGYELNKVYVLNNIYFNFDLADLNPESKDELAQLVDILTKNKKIKIEISGHTDSIGSTRYNEKLSLRRVNRVRDFLIEKGISRSRIKTVGKGSREPLASNKDEAGRRKNRRVEYVFKDENYAAKNPIFNRLN